MIGESKPTRITGDTREAVTNFKWRTPIRPTFFAGVVHRLVRQPSKLDRRVRFPLLALRLKQQIHITSEDSSEGRALD